MKRSSFREEQIIDVLQEQEAGMPTADIGRCHGISSATIYKSKSKYGGLEVLDARRLWQLEQQNERLEKLLADSMLDNAILEEINAKSSYARCHAGGGSSPGSIRGEPALCLRRAMRGRDHRALNQSSAERCKGARPEQGLASQRRRFRHRRLHWLPCWEGWSMNHKKFRRLYRSQP